METLPHRALYTIACYAPALCLVKKEWKELFRRNFCKFHPSEFRPFCQPCKVCGFVRRLKPVEQLRLWEATYHRSKRIRRRPKKQSPNSFISSVLMYGVA